MAGFLYTIIIKIISKADSHTKNSFKFVKELDSRRLIDEFQLMELLVSSLTFPLTMRWTVSKTIGYLLGVQLRFCRFFSEIRGEIYYKKLVIHL